MLLGSEKELGSAPLALGFHFAKISRNVLIPVGGAG
jgi:hypothetical protein